MIIANDSNFGEEVLLAQPPVFVEFFTTTCQPCRQIEPWLQKLEFDCAGKIKFVKIDSSKSHHTAKQFRIKIAPTIMMFEKGEVARTILGKPPTPQHLYDFVQPYLYL